MSVNFLESISAATGRAKSNSVMAVLQLYLDESGKLQDLRSGHVVFGGLAGELDEVSVFSSKWRSLLGSEIDHVHMKDAMRLEGAFKCWKGKESRRDELLIECAKLAQSESAMLVVSTMDSKDFGSLAESQRKRLKNPVYGGFEGCIRIMADAFIEHDLHIWYDEAQEYAATCLKLYQRIKNMQGDFARRLPSLTFANDERYPGLQAADMVAYSAFIAQRDGSAAPMLIREINAILAKEHRSRKKHLLYKKGASLGSGIVEH